MNQFGTTAGGRSLIQKGLTISGEIRGSGDLAVEGTVDGNIQIEGTCVLAESGAVEGNVDARTIHVSGQLNGNATATEKVEIHATGVVSGDITVPNISIADGASVNGRVTVGIDRRS